MEKNRIQEIIEGLGEEKLKEMSKQLMEHVNNTDYISQSINKNIVANLNRETMVVFKDDVEHFINRYDVATDEIEHLNILFNGFLEKRNLHDDFMAYLQEIRNEIIKTGVSYVGDIDLHIRNFEL